MSMLLDSLVAGFDGEPEALLGLPCRPLRALPREPPGADRQHRDRHGTHERLYQQERVVGG